MKRKMKWGREEQVRTEESGKRGGRAHREAFPFENFLGKLKNLVRGPSLALRQVIKSHSEMNPTTVSSSVQQKCALLKLHRDGPEPPSFKGTQY
ncbi:hypothetical protein HPB47_012808, partial [Ixodes persulcatus]